MGRREVKPASEVRPRGLAIRILGAVLSDRKPLDEVLAEATREHGLSPVARAWLQEICAGSLRWKGRLDYAIDSVALKKKPTGWLRRALLTAAYQLIAQDRVHPAAVVSETVQEIKKKEGDAPAKFANACLRKIATHAADFRALEFPAQRAEGAATPAQWASLPDWFWKNLVATRGEDWARGFAQACLDRPVVWIRSRKDGPSSLTTGSGAVTELPGFREGEILVQDISSQTLITDITAEVRKVLGEGKLEALDLCAAPGGKSAGLAWNGFSVRSTDRPDQAGEGRFELLRQTAARVGAGQIQVIARPEVAALPPQDLVWVDAPCSGSGIIRRHPDVRWIRQETELASLQKVQAELLGEAWAKVRPGGFLAYSVCSVLPEEGKTQIERAGFSKFVVREWLLSPQESPFGDGFWASLLRKEK